MKKDSNAKIPRSRSIRLVMIRMLLIMLVYAISAASPRTASARSSVQIQYTVSVSDPSAKMFHVTCRITNDLAERIELDWAAWTPGYTTIWNYGQFVKQLAAQDGSSHPLEVNHPSVNRWIIQSRNAQVVTCSYQVKAIDPAANLGFAQAYLDSVSGWYNGAALFPQIIGQRYSKESVSFTLPQGWKVATAMKRDPARNGYEVPGYDVMVDSPVQLGRFLKTNTKIDNTQIGVVVAGCDSVNMVKLTEIVRTIVKYEFHLMHGSPIRRYLFIYHAASRGAGGLEHLNATTISAPIGEFFKKDSWLKVATSHEFFHVWNAKRIHPAVFDVYDYSKPVHTKTVWFTEGITAYYADIVLYRCGLMTKSQLYGDLAHLIDLYQNNPAHRWLSWQDISWNVWSPEVQEGLSVWLIPGWMIDLEIREVTDNRYSLDDVMRFMNIWFGDGNHGFGENQIGMICSAVAQKDIRPFFRRYIDEPNPFPYSSLLSAAGLRWNVDSVRVPYLGCKLWWATATQPSWTLSGSVKIIGVIHNGIASRAGLRNGDKVISIDGEAFSTESKLKSFEEQLKRGDKLDVRVLRDGKQKTFHIVVGSREIIHSSITEIKTATKEQIEIRDGILEGKTQ